MELASALWRFDASPVLSDIAFHAAWLYDGAALATSTVPRFASHLGLPSALAHAEAPNCEDPTLWRRTRESECFTICKNK